MIFPFVHLILTHEDFAEARTMNLDAGIVSILSGGLLISKNQSATAGLKNHTGTLMVGRIKSKCLSWAPCLNEGLNQSIGCPRFLPSGFDNDGRLEWNGWEPQGIDGRRIAGHDQAQSLRSRKIADTSTKLFTKAFVQNTEIQTSGQTRQDGSHMGQCMVNFLHVSSNHHMRKPRSGGKGLDIVLRRLLVTFVTQRQCSMKKGFTSFGTDFNQLIDGEGAKGCLGITDALEVTADDAGVDRADRCQGLLVAVTLDLNLIQTFVR